MTYTLNKLSECNNVCNRRVKFKNKFTVEWLLRRGVGSYVLSGKRVVRDGRTKV